MADKVIQVNVTASKKQNVNVSAGSVQNQITATPDMSQYYSNLSKNWAMGEGLILGEGYSSKHYAQEAQTNAEKAQNYANRAEIVYNNIQDSANGVMTEIENTRAEAVESVNYTKTTAVNAVNTSKNEALNAIANTGINNLANKDLSNLSTTGEAKFSSMVNKSGDTMTGNLNINNTLPAVGFFNSEFDRSKTGTQTGSTTIGFTRLRDKNNLDVSILSTSYSAAGNLYTRLAVTRDVNGESKVSGINVGVKANGDVYTEAPTPPTGDNSTRIATTAWVNNSKATIAGWSYPSETKVTNPIPTTIQKSGNHQYVAPCDGMFTFSYSSTTGANAVIVYLNGVQVLFVGDSISSTHRMSGTLLVSKGMTISIGTDTREATGNSYFWYAKGSV